MVSGESKKHGNLFRWLWIIDVSAFGIHIYT